MPRSALKTDRKHPVRTVGGLIAVGGLLAAVIIPAATANTAPAAADSPRTVAQQAADSAQSLTVDSQAAVADVSRSSFDATTPEEIEKQKAEEAALARAKALAEQQASAAAVATAQANLKMSVGTGAIRWPIDVITYVGDGMGPRDGGYHNGVDLLSPALTPIYAAADGVVTVSSENYYGYGVGVVISHVIDGQSVETTYGHMTYGTRAVSAGETVVAGQLIGQVGSTGWSTANHLHFEVRINGSLVDPYGWLVANAG